MEAYKIWTVLEIKGNAFKEMARFEKLAKSASLVVEKLIKNVDLLTPNFGALSKEFRVINAEVMEGNAGFQKLNRHISSTSARTSNLTQKMDRLALSLKTVNAAGTNVGGGMLAMGGGGRRGHGGRHASHAMMSEAGMGALAGPSAAMMGAGYVGGAALAGVVGVGMLAHKGWESQKEYQQQMAQLRGSGLTDAQLAEADKIASVGSVGISPISKAKALNDAFMASRSWKEAKVLAPMLAEAHFAGGATFNNMTDSQQKALIKFAEMRAGSDMSKIAPAMDLGYRMMNASAGTFDPKQQAQFMKQAATVAYHLSDRGYVGLEPVMQEIGGSITGTGFQTGYQQFATGQGTLNKKKTVADLIKLGIYKGGEMDKHGRYLSTKMDPALLSLYETSPVDFTKKIMGIYAKNGTTSVDDVNRRFALDFPRTTARMMSLIMKNMGKIDRELDLYDKQPGIHSSFVTALGIPSGVSERLTNAWQTMTTSFGKLSSPAVIAGMNFLSGTLENLGTFFRLLSITSRAQGVKNIDANSQLLGPSFSTVPKALAPLHGGDGLFTELLKRKAPSATSAQGATPQTNVVLNVDGKKLGEIVVSHIADRLNSAGTVSSPSLFNTGISQPPTSFNNAGYF